MKTNWVTDTQVPAAPTGFSFPGERAGRAFTLIELLVVVAMIGCFALLLIPAVANTRPNSQGIQCLANLRQMTRAWKMYADDNSGRIVSAYPNFGGFTTTWCAGSATTGGGAGVYGYYGSDPAGIQNGLLWPYARSLNLYRCPTDHRLATDPSTPSQFKGKPILRSISMNSFLYGQSFGASTSWSASSPATAQDPNHPVYLKESEIKLPGQTFVFVDEDQASINDGMLTVDVGGAQRFIDLPSRAHSFGYNISYADGRAETIHFQDDQSRSWRVTGPSPHGGLNDWTRLVNVTTHPQ